MLPGALDSVAGTFPEQWIRGCCPSELESSSRAGPRSGRKGPGVVALSCSEVNSAERGGWEMVSGSEDPILVKSQCDSD